MIRPAYLPAPSFFRCLPDDDVQLMFGFQVSPSPTSFLPPPAQRKALRSSSIMVADLFLEFFSLAMGDKVWPWRCQKFRKPCRQRLGNCPAPLGRNHISLPGHSIEMIFFSPRLIFLLFNFPLFFSSHWFLCEILEIVKIIIKTPVISSYKYQYSLYLLGDFPIVGTGGG